MEITKELWGKTSCGKEIFLYTLKNEKGAYVQLTSIGAGIVSIAVPDKDGKLADVALGFVLLQKLPDLGIEGRGGPGEHLAEVLVDRGFGEGEVLSGGTDGAACLDHVRRQSAGTVVFVAGHGSTS